jgi:tetratricopeptide (TPR) repeat protein
VIPVLMMMLAAPVDAPPQPERLKVCLALAASEPAKALADAAAWRDANGGIGARHCMAVAQAGTNDFSGAAKSFEEAAQLAEGSQPVNAPAFWTGAGNAALAAGEAGRARALLDKALVHDTLTGPYRGEVLLDRGRADVQAGDNASARRDIDEALRLVEGDPMAWLLSATLARRMGDGERAEKDIAEAVRLAPDAAPVAYEAGNVAAMLGADEAARVAWTRTVAADPQGDLGRAAQAALATLKPVAPAEPPKTPER